MLPLSMRASGGIRSLESATTRRGWRPAVSIPEERTFMDGSSASTVPIPVRTAEHEALSRCTSSRASGPVIHRLSPLAMAVRPSRLAAVLTITRGMPRVIL
jgi:hypothetical protein